MAQTGTVRSERINLRLSEVAKRRIKQAAYVEGKTVSAFIVASALEKAEKIVRGHEMVTLAREDAIRFFDALADPPPPNDRLRAALEEHARRVGPRRIESDALVIELLGRRHRRTAFSCGLSEQDRSLACAAVRQDVRRRVSRVCVSAPRRLPADSASARLLRGSRHACRAVRLPGRLSRVDRRMPRMPSWNWHWQLRTGRLSNAPTCVPTSEPSAGR